MTTLIEAVRGLIDNAPIGDDDEPYCSDIMQPEFKALVKVFRAMTQHTHHATGE